jgi:cytochrome c oxidase cbb3-type subunit 3
MSSRCAEARRATCNVQRSGRTMAGGAGVLLALALTTLGCERETRRYREIPAASSRPESVQLTQLQPGAPGPQAPTLSPYQENAYGIAQGKQLFSAYNCNGCHAMGGGGIGPALMDEKWIYGAAPDQIYSTISQGRPNGMPAFGGKVPSQQIWQLVSYVQTLSMQVPRDAAPGRNDDLNAIKPELRLDAKRPRQTGHR